jgi:hypothetical protein
MKKIILIAVLSMLPSMAMAGDYEIRTRLPADVAEPGGIVNPYVMTDDRGNEVTLRPRYAISPDSSDRNFDPGGMFNPLEPE